jgi:hypothetical protein
MAPMCARCDELHRSLDDAFGDRMLRSASLDAADDVCEYTFR